MASAGRRRRICICWDISACGLMRWDIGAAEASSSSRFSYLAGLECPIPLGKLLIRDQANYPVLAAAISQSWKAGCDLLLIFIPLHLLFLADE